MRFNHRFHVVLAMALLAPCQLLAQAYPGKPIRLLLNVSAGVFGDIVMRAASIELAAQMGQPWVIENHPGGNFVIGANACKNAPADGYNVCMVNVESMAMNPHIISKLSYDPLKDFKPVTNLFFHVSAVVGAAPLQASSMGEVQRLANARPGTMNFATLGPGSHQDVLRQWMAAKWKTDFMGVPYKGMNLILNSIVAGECSLTLTSLGSAAPFLKSGKVKLLAIDSTRRLASTPEVPTFAEAGLAEFRDIFGAIWWGAVVPAGVPDPMVLRLNAEFARAFKEPKMVDLLDRLFLEPAIGTPQEFAAFMKSERERAGEVVKKFDLPRH